MIKYMYINNVYYVTLTTALMRLCKTIRMILYLLYLPCIQTAPSCGVEEALVSGINPIPDTQITASSEYSTNTAARYARIDNTAGAGAWLCSTAEYSSAEQRMYIQVCSLVTIKVILKKAIDANEKWKKTLLSIVL